MRHRPFRPGLFTNGYLIAGYFPPFSLLLCIRLSSIEFCVHFFFFLKSNDILLGALAHERALIERVKERERE